MTAGAVAWNPDDGLSPDDAVVALEHRIERLLADRSVRKTARALYGHMYRAITPKTDIEVLERIAEALERARIPAVS